MVFSFFYAFIDLQRERKGGRGGGEGEGEGNIHARSTHGLPPARPLLGIEPAARACALTLSWELNQWPLLVHTGWARMMFSLFHYKPSFRIHMDVLTGVWPSLKECRIVNVYASSSSMWSRNNMDAGDSGLNTKWRWCWKNSASTNSCAISFHRMGNPIHRMRWVWIVLRMFAIK